MLSFLLLGVVLLLVGLLYQKMSRQRAAPDSPRLSPVSPTRSEAGKQQRHELAARRPHLEEEDGEAGQENQHESYDGSVAVVVHSRISSLGNRYEQSSHSHWPRPRIQ